MVVDAHQDHVFNAHWALHPNISASRGAANRAHHLATARSEYCVTTSFVGGSAGQNPPRK